MPKTETTGSRPPAGIPAPRSQALPAAIAALAVAILALAGVMLRQQGGGASEAGLRGFIAENPQFIIDTLNRHARESAEAERRQSVDLVKANDGLTVMGNPDGDVTIYEFSDYNCGYCKRSFGDLMRLIEEDGDVRLVIKEFPILSEGSAIAARHALAAAELGRFGDFHRAVMSWPGRIDESAVDQIVDLLELDRADLNAALAGDGIEATIEENNRIARQLGLTGTPAFVVGDTVVPGAIGLDQFRELVAGARASGKG